LNLFSQNSNLFSNRLSNMFFDCNYARDVFWKLELRSAFLNYSFSFDYFQIRFVAHIRFLTVLEKRQKSSSLVIFSRPLRNFKYSSLPRFHVYLNTRLEFCFVNKVLQTKDQNTKLSTIFRYFLFIDNLNLFGENNQYVGDLSIQKMI